MSFLKEKCEKYVAEYLNDYEPYKGKWCYEDGCLLQGAMLLYKATNEERYLKFILAYLNEFIGDHNMAQYDNYSTISNDKMQRTLNYPD